MLASAHKLKQMGADFVICPDNTIHQALPLIEARSPLPWLHIADGVAAEADRRGFLRIAILGTRGIPANYGGFETFAERLSTRLAARGHEVTVYCRAHYTSPRQLEYQGVRLKVLPTIRHKYFDTVVHSFVSALHAVPQRYDAALICNAANAPLASILRLTGTPVAINVDGLEHKRKKWNWIARRYYLLAEKLAIVLPTETVTDAR